MSNNQILISQRELLPMASYGRSESLWAQNQVGFSDRMLTWPEIEEIIAHRFSKKNEESVSLPSQWLDREDIMQGLEILSPYRSQVALQISAGAELEQYQNKCEQALQLGFRIEVLMDRVLSFRQENLLGQWRDKGWLWDIIYFVNRENNPVQDMALLRPWVGQQEKHSLKLVFMPKHSPYDYWPDAKEIKIYLHWLAKDCFRSQFNLSIIQYRQNELKIGSLAFETEVPSKNWIYRMQVAHSREQENKSRTSGSLNGRSNGQAGNRSSISEMRPLVFLEILLDFIIYPTWTQLKQTLFNLGSKLFYFFREILSGTYYLGPHRFYYKVPHRLFHLVKNWPQQILLFIRHDLKIFLIRLFYNGPHAIFHWIKGNYKMIPVWLFYKGPHQLYHMVQGWPAQAVLFLRHDLKIFLIRLFYNGPHRLYHLVKSWPARVGLFVLHNLKLFFQYRIREAISFIYFKTIHRSYHWLVMNIPYVWIWLRHQPAHFFSLLYYKGPFAALHFMRAHFKPTSIRIYYFFYDWTMHRGRMVAIHTFYRLRHAVTVVTLFLMYPLRKIYWFVSYQYQTRIRRNA